MNLESYKKKNWKVREQSVGAGEDQGGEAMKEESFKKKNTGCFR